MSLPWCGRIFALATRTLRELSADLIAVQVLGCAARWIGALPSSSAVPARRCWWGIAAFAVGPGRLMGAGMSPASEASVSTAVPAVPGSWR